MNFTADPGAQLLLGILSVGVGVLYILLPFWVLAIKRRLAMQEFVLRQIFKQLGGEIGEKNGEEVFYTSVAAARERESRIFR